MTPKGGGDTPNPGAEDKIPMAMAANETWGVYPQNYSMTPLYYGSRKVKGCEPLAVFRGREVAEQWARECDFGPNLDVRRITEGAGAAERGDDLPASEFVLSAMDNLDDAEGAVSAARAALKEAMRRDMGTGDRHPVGQPLDSESIRAAVKDAAFTFAEKCIQEHERGGKLNLVLPPFADRVRALAAQSGDRPSVGHVALPPDDAWLPDGTPEEIGDHIMRDTPRGLSEAYYAKLIALAIRRERSRGDRPAPSPGVPGSLVCEAARIFKEYVSWCGKGGMDEGYFVVSAREWLAKYEAGEAGRPAPSPVSKSEAYIAHIVHRARKLVAGMPYTMGQPGHGEHERLRDAVRELDEWERAGAASPGAPLEPTLWMVLRKRDTDPIETWTGTESEMRAMFDRVGANWTETYLVRVEAGPRDVLEAGEGGKQGAPDPLPGDLALKFREDFEFNFLGGPMFYARDDEQLERIAAEFDKRLTAFLEAHVADLRARAERLEREIAQPPVELLERWMQNELSDYRMVIDHCTRTYSHFSRGRISKPNTLPEEVIREAEEFETRDIEDAVNEATEELRAERDGLAAEVRASRALDDREDHEKDGIPESDDCAICAERRTRVNDARRANEERGWPSTPEERP